jgi:hypothetical protein
MKAKKAIKRLAKAESLLANVRDQYPAANNGLRELLDSAKTSVSQARASIDLETAPVKKTASTAKQSGGSRLSAAGRRRISAAAKKRWAAARSKGVNAVTGQKLSKTA